jgi:hypothetical protein
VHQYHQYELDKTEFPFLTKICGYTLLRNGFALDKTFATRREYANHQLQPAGNDMLPVREETVSSFCQHLGLHQAL